MNLDKTLIIALIIVLVVMGPKQLPKIAQMLGKSAKALKDGIDGKLDEDEDAATAKTRETPEA